MRERQSDTRHSFWKILTAGNTRMGGKIPGLMRTAGETRSGGVGRLYANEAANGDALLHGISVGDYKAARW